MKVDMNQIIGDEETPKKSKQVKSPKKSKSEKSKSVKEKPAKQENVYKEALKGYADKWKSKPDKKDVSSNESEQTSPRNVYKESLKQYRDKFKAHAGNGGLFRTNKFWIVLGVILFLVFLSVNSNTSRTRNQLTVLLKRATAETQQLNDAVDEVKADLEEQARIDAMQLTEEQEQLAMKDAKVQGDNVMRLQNAYKSIYSPEDQGFEAGTEEYKEAQDAYIKALNENKNSLSVYFDEDTYNGQSIWYDSQSGLEGTWEFVTKASFRGDSMKVLWLCYTDDRILLAYTTGKYSATTEKFSNIEIHKTAYAIANTISDGTEPTVTEQTQSLAESFDNLLEDGTITVDDSELTEDDINTNNDLFDSREALKNASDDVDNAYQQIGLWNDSDDNSGEQDSSENE